MTSISLKTLAFVALTSSLPVHTALACGGFFCGGVPIDQNAERLLFAFEDDGSVEAHIQISFEGEAEDFAWIVPAPSLPELFLSSDDMFLQLAQVTQPSFIMTRREEGSCWDRVRIGFANQEMSMSDSDSAGIDVISEQQVGPFDTAILQADSAEDLLDWLQDNDYDLPDSLDSALSPYVAQGSYFVALRLHNGEDVGSIEPIGMRYAGDKAVIPIQLTSIAATPDMRLEVYVLGEHRAVPDSYLHVKINEAAVDWFGFGRNYADVITQAANEAGGHAFATDFSGPTPQLAGFGESLDAMFTRHKTLTRMTSSMSPSEMTLDPTFVLNPDMGEVSNIHTAELVYQCGGGRYRGRAKRQLVLADGRAIFVPSEHWFRKNETTPTEFLSELGAMGAIMVEETGKSGAPTPLFDGTADAEVQLNAFNRWVKRTVGACSSLATVPAGLGAGFLLVVGLMRRRKSGERA